MKHKVWLITYGDIIVETPMEILPEVITMGQNGLLKTFVLIETNLTARNGKDIEAKYRPAENYIYE